MGDSTQQHRSELKQSAAQAMESAKNLTTEVHERAADFVEAATDEVREGAANLMDAAIDEAGNLETVIVKAIRDNPIQSMWIAIGCGCVIGLLISRR